MALAFGSLRGRSAALLVAAAIAAAAALRLRLLDLPLERDEGDYAYAAQLLLAGVPPYAEAYEMRMPGVFLAYASFLAAFGESAAAIRLGLALVNAASAALLYRLGSRLADPTAGATAAVAFAALSLGSGVLGLVANTEHFAILPVIAALLLLAGPTGAGRAAAAGGLLGLAFLVKQTAAPLVACGVAVAWSGARRRGEPATRAALACATAACLPVLAAGLALWLTGSFASFWFWTVVYPLTYAAAPAPALLWEAARGEVARAVGGAAPLWILAAAGAAAGLRTPRLRPAARLGLWWLACAAAALAVGQRFRPQHFLLLLPPAALLAGLAASALAGLRALRGAAALRAARIALVGLAVLASLWGDRDLLLRMDPRAASRTLHGPNPFPESVEIARWIREHSAPDDRIAVLGSEPQIYFYSGRRAATPYILTYELVQPHAHAARMQEEMLADLEASPPRFVVFVNMGISWRAAPGVENRLLDWYRDRVPRRYVQVGQINVHSPERTEYVWGAAARTAPRAARGWIAVWEARPTSRSQPPLRGGPAATPRGARRAPRAARR
jgi:hypothetical protein